MNDRIRVPRVRVVGADGAQIGILEINEALNLAASQDLDLVEVAGQADPPVCRIMDYGKYKYEQAVKQKESRKKQSLVVVKEIKMRPKIDRHDYGTKKGHVVRFLRQGAKVKVTIMFRGREMAHLDLGKKLLDRLAEDVVEVAKVEVPAKVDGRNMTMVLNPLKEAITPRPAPTPRFSTPRPEQEPEAATEVETEAPQTEDEAEPTASPPVKVTRAEGG
ncbi:MAG TPA: translation initiation factor IF-3 [Actinomycetota bacterium]|nr:translation initiation factor IF-3 [Actinomycetota bacterium]